jgi:hypothetical protein
MELPGAAIAAATARCPRLRDVCVTYTQSEMTAADVATWARAHTVTLDLDLVESEFTGRGFDGLTEVRTLTVQLPDPHVFWVGDAFSKLRHLASLTLTPSVPDLTTGLHGSAGLFTGVAPTLRRVDVDGVTLTWEGGEEPDGGAALLRPLAGVADVSLTNIIGLTDAGVAALAGAERLALIDCRDVTCGALGALRALTRLRVIECPRFCAAAFPSVAGGCRRLERVEVQPSGAVGGYPFTTVDWFGSRQECRAARRALSAGLRDGDGARWHFSCAEPSVTCASRPLVRLPAGQRAAGDEGDDSNGGSSSAEDEYEDEDEEDEGEDNDEGDGEDDEDEDGEGAAEDGGEEASPRRRPRLTPPPPQ